MYAPINVDTVCYMYTCIKILIITVSYHRTCTCQGGISDDL